MTSYVPFPPLFFSDWSNVLALSLVPTTECGFELPVQSQVTFPPALTFTLGVKLLSAICTFAVWPAALAAAVVAAAAAVVAPEAAFVGAVVAAVVAAGLASSPQAANPSPATAIAEMATAPNRNRVLNKI